MGGSKKKSIFYSPHKPHCSILSSYRTAKCSITTKCPSYRTPARQANSLLNTSQPSQHKLIAHTAGWMANPPKPGLHDYHAIVFILVNFDNGSIDEHSDWFKSGAI